MNHLLRLAICTVLFVVAAMAPFEAAFAGDLPEDGPGYFLLVAVSSPLYLLHFITQWAFVAGIAASILFYRSKEFFWLLVAAISPYGAVVLLRTAIAIGVQDFLLRKLFFQTTVYALVVAIWYCSMFIIATRKYLHGRNSTKTGA